MINSLNESLNNNAGKGLDFLQFEKEAFIGMFKEDKIHFNFQLNKYEAFDISYRCSQVKTLMILVAMKSRKIDPELVSRFCDMYSFGMCIVDDMEDWEEDFDNGRFTYAIQYAMTQENLRYLSSEHDKIKQQICKILFFSPVYFQLRNKISEALMESLKLAATMSAELKRIVIDSAKAVEVVTLEHADNLRKIEENFAMSVQLKNDNT